MSRRFCQQKGLDGEACEQEDRGIGLQAYDKEKRTQGCQKQGTISFCFQPKSVSAGLQRKGQNTQSHRAKDQEQIKEFEIERDRVQGREGYRRYGLPGF